MRKASPARHSPIPSPSSEASTAVGAVGIAVLFVGGLMAASYPAVAAGVVVGALAAPLARRVYRVVAAFRARRAASRLRRSDTGVRARPE